MARQLGLLVCDLCCPHHAVQNSIVFPQVTVDRPDVQGRIQILRVHSKGKVLGKDVDLDKIARRTPGFTGAWCFLLTNKSSWGPYVCSSRTSIKVSAAKRFNCQTHLKADVWRIVKPQLGSNDASLPSNVAPIQYKPDFAAPCSCVLLSDQLFYLTH